MGLTVYTRYLTFYNGIITSMGASHITSFSIVYSIVFRHRSKKTTNLRVICLCEGNSLVTGEFLAQRASHTENVSIWWHHHALGKSSFFFTLQLSCFLLQPSSSINGPFHTASPSVGVSIHLSVHPSVLPSMSACHTIFTPQPSGLEGYCRHSPGGRAGRWLPNLRNPHLCNRLMDFLHSKFCGIV